jgi:hypothetical protein
MIVKNTVFTAVSVATLLFSGLNASAQKKKNTAPILGTNMITKMITQDGSRICTTPVGIDGDNDGIIQDNERTGYAWQIMNGPNTIIIQTINEKADGTAQMKATRFFDNDPRDEIETGAFFTESSILATFKGLTDSSENLKSHAFFAQFMQFMNDFSDKKKIGFDKFFPTLKKTEKTPSQARQDPLIDQIIRDRLADTTKSKTFIQDDFLKQQTDIARHELAKALHYDDVTVVKSFGNEKQQIALLMDAHKADGQTDYILFVNDRLQQNKMELILPRKNNTDQMVSLGGSYDIRNMQGSISFTDIGMIKAVLPTQNGIVLFDHLMSGITKEDNVGNTMARMMILSGGTLTEFVKFADRYYSPTNTPK